MPTYVSLISKQQSNLVQLNTTKFEKTMRYTGTSHPNIVLVVLVCWGPPACARGWGKKLLSALFKPLALAQSYFQINYLVF